MLLRLRVLTFYTIIAFVVTAIFIGICIPVFIFNPGFKIRYQIAKIFSYAFVYLMKWICGITFEVEGLEKLPKDRPYLALPNHQSFWENFFVQLIIPIHSWVIKKELFDIPVFGWGLRVAQPIAVDRSNNHSVGQILKEGEKKIKEGYSLVIFPESTRVKPGKNVSLKPSAAKLALNTGVPIAIIVHNAGLYWPKGFWFERSGTIKVKVVEVLDEKKIAEFEDARKLTTYIQEVMHREKDALLEPMN